MKKKWPPLIWSVFLSLVITATLRGDISVRFLSPQEDELWIGPKRVSLLVEHLADLPLGTIEFYINGKLIKESTTPPFTFEYDFGQSPRNYKLKAILRNHDRKVLAVREISSSQFDDNVLVKVTNIILPVIVTDERGIYISDLEKDDFEVLEEGLPQNISYFSRSGSTNFHLVMLFDISSSMKDKMGIIKRAAINFLNKLLTAQDKVKLIYFNHDILEDTDFTNDKKEIGNSLALVFPFGATALYDAIAQSISYLKGIHSRCDMIIFSDGLDNSSLIDPFNLIKKVEKSNTKIYSISSNQTNTTRTADDLSYEEIFAKITATTGGKSFFIASVQEMDTVYSEINKEMRSEYILQISPEKQLHRYHRIQVRLKNRRGLKIRAPQGYFY